MKTDDIFKLNSKALKVKKLFYEKKFSDAIFLIENTFENIEKTSEIFNLLGVCKLQKKNSNNFDLISAIDNFRDCYLKEKRTNQGLEGLANFIVCCIKVHQYEEPIKYFEEAVLFFGYIPRLFNLIVKVYQNLNDVDNTIYYLKKMIENKDMQNYSLLKYIYFNSFQNKWTQSNFFENTKKVEQTLPNYSVDKLISLNRNKNKKIKLGFLSSDIKNKHSVTGFLKTIVKNVNKKKFELFLFSNSKMSEEDKTTEDFKIYFDKWVNISELDDIEAINIIRKNNINIIIDLMGLTSSNRICLFKNRLAPIQILWLGYNNTSGLNQMDYLIADPNLIRENEVDFYSEKILFMPNIWNCHSGFEFLRKENPSPLLKNKYITFGSFNDFQKISDEVIKTWSKILKKVNNAKLILKSSGDHSDKILKKKFKQNGVLSSITFLYKTDTFEDHIKEYNKIDIALDTFPYNGVTTSFEAIWMGVPVIVLKGFNPNSRAGQSINQNINMDYLIANNEDEYISKAVEFSNNFENVIKIRKNLFDQTIDSNLFNDKKFSNSFFESLEKILL